LKAKCKFKRRSNIQINYRRTKRQFRLGCG
jgi:hypothetical protein